MIESERTLRKAIALLGEFLDKGHRLKAEFEKDPGEIQARKEDKPEDIDKAIIGEDTTNDINRSDPVED